MIQVLVNRDVNAVEAAGFVWEPEEPELPAALYVTWDQAGVIASLLPCGASCWTDQDRQDASYLAAARRYNYMPKIESAFRHWQKSESGDRGEENLFGNEMELLLKEAL